MAWFTSRKTPLWRHRVDEEFFRGPYPVRYIEAVLAFAEWKCIQRTYLISAVEFVTGLSFTNEMFLFTFTLHECGAHGLIKSNFILQF